MRPILGPTFVDPPTPVEEEGARGTRRRAVIVAVVLLALGLLRLCRRGDR